MNNFVEDGSCPNLRMIERLSAPVVSAANSGVRDQIFTAAHGIGNALFGRCEFQPGLLVGIAECDELEESRFARRREKNEDDDASRQRDCCHRWT